MDFSNGKLSPLQWVLWGLATVVTVLWGRTEWRSRHDVQRLEALETDHVTRSEFEATRHDVESLKVNQVTREKFDSAIGELRGSMVASLQNSFNMLREYMTATLGDAATLRQLMHEENQHKLDGLQLHLNRQDAELRANTLSLSNIQGQVDVLNENRRMRERLEDKGGEIP